ncbi:MULTISPECIES: site-specific integrase [Legionella]|uniref:site-specific integrase n=1 Tax=Legionella TaxID=445 RepID=UPI00095F5B82|nr:MULTISPECIES: site-specific integrase [Legionella]MBN9226675.1 site-specific integrase [Legionella steelei]OJW12315.1 MAG: recombinase [Legionella sp. 39-23]
MLAKISNSLIKQLVPREKEYDVRDINLKGFLIRVQPSGSMAYICQYKRGRRVNLGKVGVISAAQAREKAIEVLSNFHKGIEPTVKKGINKPKTLQEFIENEYKPWALSHHKRGVETLAALNRCFKNLYPKPLAEITPAVLEQWRVKRLNEGTAHATINRNITTLKSLITKATEWGFLKENTLRNLKQFKVDRSPKVRYLSLEEEVRLRQALLERERQLKQERISANEWRKVRGHSLYPEFADNELFDYLMPMVLISINTGLRRGELFNLTWEMINLSERSLILGGEITKNSSSRYIPLNDEAYNLLNQLYSKSELKKGLVFPSKNNQPFNHVKRSWASVLGKAEIAQFRWHDLRHHFASKLVMAGVDLNTVRELLGHSDIKMTLRYAHLAPEYKINAVKKIDWSFKNNAVQI